MRCHHCDQDITEAAGGVFVHDEPSDPSRPDVCSVGDDYSATPHRSFELCVTLTNEDTDCRFSEWTEPVEDWLLHDDGTPDFGAIYRATQREYGRCTSSVYVDREGQSPARVGWFFVSRQQYEDTPENYVRGAWVTVRELVEPAMPARYRSGEVA